MATNDKKPKAGSYGAEQIAVLEGLEPVRKRPGMYIGSTGPDGLHHLIWEVVDNSFDEAMAGHADHIIVTLNDDGSVSVHDNGRGIPVDIHKQYKVSALELVLTKLHAGGKFGGDASGYKVSGGLHGVGVSVVNALSDWLEVVVERDGGMYTQRYERGIPTGKVKQIGNSRNHGTKVTFFPDASIFETIQFDSKRIIERLRQQCYLTKGIHLTVVDAKRKPASSYGFYFEGGVASYVRHLNHAKHPKHDSVFYVEKQVDNALIEIGLQYTEDYNENLFAFANNIFNPEGGSHVMGFRAALTRVLNNYSRTKGYLKEKDDNLTGEDVREGLTAVISIKIPEPQFEGQTKAKLGNPEVRGAVETVMGEALAMFLEEHPRDAEAIIGKCVLAQRARAAARAARDTVLRKGALEGFTLPGKLADCSTKDASQSELYIVEGDSAGGCFSGDTCVALTDGRNLSFAKLVEEHAQGKENFCYTIDAEGHVQMQKIANPRITKHDAKVIKIVLDSGEEIICTPDHRFMMRDGSYTQAQELSTTDSLMPLYRKSTQAVLDPVMFTWTSQSQRATEQEAVAYFNHKIKAIVPLEERIDVYDIEVPGTHNFALASGVFVHNSAKQGRNREFQAILPLRGKILNVERARIDKMLANNEIKSLVIAMGTNIGELFDVAKLRYNRIIIMTDADVDGAHIRTLLLTLYYRYFPQVISDGHLYIAQPPLFRLQLGKEVHWAFSEEERDKIEKDLLKLREEKAKSRGGKAEETPVEEAPAQVAAVADEGLETVASRSAVSIQRYKGLGEMNPEQLWETTMDPSNRVMKRVTIDDAEAANETFDILMGAEVAPRKKFIQTHAKNATLDV